MKKKLKLKTTIKHSFDIETDAMDDLDFTVDIPLNSIKKKKRITEKKKRKFKNNESTGLF